MITSVLASGSKGNATFLFVGNDVILIDAGMTCAYIEEQMKDLNISKIDFVILTHTHADHVGGLKVIIKKYNPVIYLTLKMYKELEIKLDNYCIIDGNFNIKDLNVEVFKTSHDVLESNGYIFNYDNKSIVYITDTGYINVKYHKMLTNKNLYIIESNHDIEKLMNGSYPYHLKQRILSDEGHLSNKDCCYYLKTFIGPNTTDIVLIHLSEENNTEELAYNEIKNTLNEINRNDINVIISKQKERTDLIKL